MTVYPRYCCHMFPARSRGGCGGNKEHPAPATATPIVGVTASKVRQPSQLPPEQRHIHQKSNTGRHPDQISPQDLKAAAP
eukprot:334352-Pelagomonas_calceolata.AAC.1